MHVILKISKWVDYMLLLSMNLNERRIYYLFLSVFPMIETPRQNTQKRTSESISCPLSKEKTDLMDVKHQHVYIQKGKVG